MILRLEKIVFIIKGLILYIGFPNNKYNSNIKNYLRCLLIGEGEDLVLGERDYCKIVVIYCCGNDRTCYILIVFLLRRIA